MKKILVYLLFIIFFCYPLYSNDGLSDFDPSQWYFPYLGSNAGYFDLSCGFHIWSDRFDIRNLQFTNVIYLSPGFRFFSVLRANNQMAGMTDIQPRFDECFLEWLGFYNQSDQKLSYSLKLGETRYLRFPYPDIISMYDQVPGIEDLSGEGQTSYKGILMTGEYEWQHFGYHITMLQWLYSNRTGLNLVENYGFYKNNLSLLDIELRFGQLQERAFPLGDSALGYSVYLGAKAGQSYKVGFLYEYLETEGIRTGILVQFEPNLLTELFGKYRVDYTRSPQGIGLQPTLFKGQYGFLSAPPEGAALVGEVVTERTITYWQNGQGRNHYEHIVSHSGNTTDLDLKIVMKELPRYLKIESLVSKYHQFYRWADFEAWEKKRQGPAQLSQKVVYQYYKPSSLEKN